MELRPEIVAKLRERLARACPPERLALGPIETFAGASPHGPGPTTLCKVETGEDGISRQDLLARLRPVFPKIFADGSSGTENEPTARAGEIAEILGSVVARLLSAFMKVEIPLSIREESARAAWLRIERPADTPTLQALNIAFIVVGYAMQNSVAIRPTPASLSRLRDHCEAHKPNLESQLLIATARRLDIPFLQINNDESFWQFGWGCRSERFWGNSSNADGMIAHWISRNKDATKLLLRDLGMPTPAWRGLGPKGDFRAAAKAIGWPVAVKPLDRGAGRGVNANIRDFASLERAVAVARGIAPNILIERHEPGDDHRLMVIDGRLAMAIRREQPAVVGDGTRSVGDLVSALNEARRNDGGPRNLQPVPEDEILNLTLAGQGLTRDVVIPAGCRVFLRSNANHSTGGDCAEVLDQVHPQIARFAEHIGQAFGFRIAGIDYITTDISRSHEEVGGGFIEINATPGIEVFGQIVPKNVTELVLGPRPGRIPVCFVLAPAEVQEDLANAVAEMLEPCAGMVTTMGSRVGRLALPPNALSPPERVSAMLRYATLDSLVIVWAVEDLIRYGLPIDKVERSVVVGTAPDDWIAMLRERSTTVSMVDDASEAVKASRAKSARKNATPQPSVR